MRGGSAFEQLGDEDEMILPRLMYENGYLIHESLFEKYSDKIKNIKKNTVIDTADGNEDNIFYIYEGVTEWVINDDEGKENILLYVGKGNIFPLPCMEMPLPMKEHIIFKAITDMKVLVIPCDLFKDIMLESVDVNMNVLKCYSQICDSLLSIIHLKNNNTSLNRISTLIYMLHSEADKYDMIIKLSQEEIAQITSVSRVQVTRVLKKLRDENIIITKRREIIVANSEKLKSFCTSD